MHKKTHQEHIHIHRSDEQMLVGNTLEGRKSLNHWIRGKRERAEQIWRDRLGEGGLGGVSYKKTLPTPDTGSHKANPHTNEGPC